MNVCVHLWRSKQLITCSPPSSFSLLQPAPYHDFDSVPESSSSYLTSFQTHFNPSELQYDPYYQWQEQQPPAEPPTRQMRLVKVSSDVLSEMERIAIIDSRSEGCSVGRDRSFDPRIRLADLEVSKTHCHLFFLQSGETNEFGFAISDIGSTHGTFVLSNSTLEEEDLSSLPTSSFQRLSPSKKASSPFF